MALLMANAAAASFDVITNTSCSSSSSSISISAARSYSYSSASSWSTLLTITRKARDQGKNHNITAVVHDASLMKDVLQPFYQKRALKIISGLQNFDKDNVASVVIAADKGGATHVDIACDAELVKLALTLTSLPICVSSVDPAAFLPAVDAGAHMIEIGNYDSFYEAGIIFSPEQIVKLTQETRKALPFIPLSVTVPHTLCLPDQVKLAELLEQEGADIIQTEGGKSSTPSNPGVIGLIQKATPTLAAAYSISRAVKIPVMCASGLSAVTAPMALTAGAAGIGVGSAVNKLNDVVAMIAVVRSIADSMHDLTTNSTTRSFVAEYSS